MRADEETEIVRPEGGTVRRLLRVPSDGGPVDLGAVAPRSTPGLPGAAGRGKDRKGWARRQVDLIGVGLRRQQEMLFATAKAAGGPDALTSAPAWVGPESRRIEPDPRRGGPESRRGGSGSRWVEPESRRGGPESRRAGSGSGWVEPESRWVEPESRRGGSGSRRAEPESRRGGPESRRAGSGSRWVEPEPRRAGPEASRVEPGPPRGGPEPDWGGPEPDRGGPEPDRGRPEPDRGRPGRVLLVLQALDCGGKDGTVKRVAGAMNPLGLHIRSFGPPAGAERRHDFLWRIRRALPPPGCVGVFNRSHYEDVLVARVDGLVPEETWRARYEQINAFERELTDGGVTLVKVFLHISRDEQAQRLAERLTDPTKYWKYSPSDLDSRARWDDYQAAYAEALGRCGGEDAPWFVVPADRKWYRDWAVAHLLRETFEGLDLGYPAAGFDVERERQRLWSGSGDGRG
ncbi:PPK2 family polyphosphate kinase [Micromonospora sp. NPDC092111]|uniref:PPK2 family polyphosphate kinase n=1 Tax=Micromonospora sp. NPDC092111 TaxID=3364289 RepID=UPI003827855E